MPQHPVWKYNRGQLIEIIYPDYRSVSIIRKVRTPLSKLLVDWCSSLLEIVSCVSVLKNLVLFFNTMRSTATHSVRFYYYTFYDLRFSTINVQHNAKARISLKTRLDERPCKVRSFLDYKKQWQCLPNCNIILLSI